MMEVRYFSVLAALFLNASIFNGFPRYMIAASFKAYLTDILECTRLYAPTAVEMKGRELERHNGLPSQISLCHPVPEKLDEKELVTFKEMFMANSIQVYAMAQLRIEKGMIKDSS